MSDLLPLIAVALPALAAGAAIGVAAGRGKRARAQTADTPGAPPLEDETVRLRAQALEAAAEPVLIVASDGRVLDCNASALDLLDRHRGAVRQLEATALRTLFSPSGVPLEWSELVALCAPWSGEAQLRLPDGSRRVSAVRLVPIFSTRGEVSAFVEVYHEPLPDRPFGADSFVRALDAESEAALESLPPAEGARRELQLLAMGFADLDRVLRQYELLLPAMRAEDPLTEAIAGLAAETSEVASAADVPRLLEELPRTLERLRAHLQRLAASQGSGAGAR